MKVFICLEWHDDKRSFEGHWDPVIVYKDENDAKEWMNEKNTENRDYREIQLISKGEIK